MKYRSRLAYHVALLSARNNGRRYSQQEIADVTGLTQATVSKWMSRRPITRVEFSAVKPLADFVGCEWYELVEEYEENGSSERLRATAAV